MNRRTSLYLLQVKVPEGDSLSVDELYKWAFETCWKEVAGSLPVTNGFTLLFRAENDEVASDVADYLAAGREYTVQTGLGVHRREVKAA